MNGCYDDSAFLCLVSRCWETDKSDINPAVPAAGRCDVRRVDLHHYQPNTLTEDKSTWRDGGRSAQYKHGGRGINRATMHQARTHLAKKGGLRNIVETFKKFVLADDNVDDLIDVSEFRRASAESGLRWSEEEETDIFEALGTTAGTVCIVFGGARTYCFSRFYVFLCGGRGELGIGCATKKLP